MTSANVAEVDLAVIGAGLSGCSLIGRLHQLKSDLNVALIEAGRGQEGEPPAADAGIILAGCSTMGLQVSL